MIKMLRCRKCDKSHLELDAVTANITLRKSSHCSECNHSHEKKYDYFFCSVKCMLSWLEDHPNILADHSDGLKTEPHWPLKNVDGVMKNVLAGGE